MCGRFAQYRSRDDYFEAAGIRPDEILYDPEPIGRFNVAPGTRVLLLNARNEGLFPDPVFWGYGPEWWQKQPLINARGETAASSRMFKPLWSRGRSVVPADGWYEWKKDGKKKQPYFIYRADKQPLFFAAIGKGPFNEDHGHEGFVIVTADSNQGMVDIHDRRPLVLYPDAVREWLSNETRSERAEEIIHHGVLPETAFTWHPVSRAVGNIRNHGENLIARIENPEI